MESEGSDYCQHFEYLKINTHFAIDRQSACKFCLHGPNQLWVCLAKGCGVAVCNKNNSEHLISHLQQSRRQKKFHSIYISTATAQIHCIQCNIEIKDLDVPSNSKLKHKQDPFPCRVRVLPGLSSLLAHKIQGQLQNSQGHMKISRGLVGLFSNKYNYSINAAIQFISHCRFFRQLILQLNLSKSSKLLRGLQEVVREIEMAKYRSVHSDVVTEVLYKEMPWLLGYRKKDPFDMVLHLLAAINDATFFHTLFPEIQHQEVDEWDMFYRKQAIQPHHLVYNAIESTLSLNYSCLKCKKDISLPHNIQFLKLNIPKKKRKTREVEKQLADHRVSSPVKNRRKSLMNLFKEEECPLTIPELIIQLMKSPLHKEVSCEQCGYILKKTKLHFDKLPDILVIQVARMGREGTTIDETPIELNTETLDMGPFTSNPKQEILYDFESALCIEKGCVFPLLVVGEFNKQTYLVRNQTVEMTKQKHNPYLICYKRRASPSARQKLTEIDDDLKSQRQKNYILPDFWYMQIQNGIERPFVNQFVCRHNRLKPNLHSKLTSFVRVSRDVYEDLNHFYSIISFQEKEMASQDGSGTPSMRLSRSKSIGQQLCYVNLECEICREELEMVQQRRKLEREYVLYYDRIKGKSIPLCMVSCVWLKKWSNFLYNKSSFGYMAKGHPFPPLIDNKVLLDGSKCKPNLVRNQDYKIVNMYLWKFLKELYGGGPEIRYRWKQAHDTLDEELLADIRSKAAQLKYLYTAGTPDSPKKLGTTMSFIQKSTILDINQQMLEQEMEQFSLQSPKKGR